MEEEEFRRLSDQFDALARTRPRAYRWRVTGLVARAARVPGAELYRRDG